MRFEFATATRIIFGEGEHTNIGQHAAEMGQRALLVTGTAGNSTQTLADRLENQNVAAHMVSIRGEPTIETIQRALEAARQFQADLVIGLGGGSAIDSAKAIAAMLTNPGELSDYLEVVGLGRTITNMPVPVIALPTTAGTGAEVTRNAVIGVPEFGVKASLRSPLMLPRLALVDPELTYDLPPELTASTGLDALTQLVEPYVCNTPNPISDAICREGIKHSAGSLLRAYQNGQDASARCELSLASLLGGLALANARLGAVHGIAGVLGGLLPIAHGAICARLLPLVMEVNLRALTTRLPDSPALDRYREIGQLLTADSRATATDGVNWVRELSNQLKVQPLGSFGLQHSLFSEIVEKSFRASSMKGNPITLMPDELLEILERAS